jgi:uracil-DNA glycosylase
MEPTATTSKKTFFDESSESDETSVVIHKEVILFTPTRNFLSYVFVDIKKYNFDAWDKFIKADPDKKVQIRKMLFNQSWSNFFFGPNMSKIVSDLENDLTKLALKGTIVPPPELVFNAFNVVSLDDIKVVFIGQDPYPGKNNAMGFSFSLPMNLPRTSSLLNIFSNLKKFGHIKEMPKTGCLSYWVLQGCFMINSQLTTYEGTPDAHVKPYEKFSPKVMKHLNDNCKNLVVIVWGSKAFKMAECFDRNKHCVIVSSHPSGRSFNKTFSGYLNGETKTYPAFETVDHFGLANKHLSKKGKEEILWDMII